MTKRRIEYVALDKLKAAKRNPKRHDDEAIQQSVERFGYVEPIVVDDRTGRMVAGHGRVASLQALRKAGKAPPAGVDKSWRVPVLRGWASKTDAEAEAYLVASNRLVEVGGWDEAELAKLLGGLSAKGALAGVGFSADDLTKFTDDGGSQPLVNVWQVLVDVSDEDAQATLIGGSFGGRPCATFEWRGEKMSAREARALIDGER